MNTCSDYELQFIMITNIKKFIAFLKLFKWFINIILLTT